MVWRSSTTYFSKNAAFSILEVLVTAAIIGIITAVIVLNYSSFNNAVLLKSQAYEIALDIREAQQFAVSVRGAGGEFREDYGLYFSTSEPGQYRLFRDQGTIEKRDDTGRLISLAYYDDGEEIGPPYFIDSRFAISSICVNDCAHVVDDLSISFRGRPDFDAHFASVSADGYGIADIIDAEIVLTNVVGTNITKSITINAVGKVSVTETTQ